MTSCACRRTEFEGRSDADKEATFKAFRWDVMHNQVLGDRKEGWGAAMMVQAIFSFLMTKRSKDVVTGEWTWGYSKGAAAATPATDATGASAAATVARPKRTASRVADVLDQTESTPRPKASRVGVASWLEFAAFKAAKRRAASMLHLVFKALAGSFALWALTCAQDQLQYLFDKHLRHLKLKVHVYAEDRMAAAQKVANKVWRVFVRQPCISFSLRGELRRLVGFTTGQKKLFFGVEHVLSRDKTTELLAAVERENPQEEWVMVNKMGRIGASFGGRRHLRRIAHELINIRDDPKLRADFDASVDMEHTSGATLVYEPSTSAQAPTLGDVLKPEKPGSHAYDQAKHWVSTTLAGLKWEEDVSYFAVTAVRLGFEAKDEDEVDAATRATRSVELRVVVGFDATAEVAEACGRRPQEQRARARGFAASLCQAPARGGRRFGGACGVDLMGYHAADGRLQERMTREATGEGKATACEDRYNAFHHGEHIEMLSATSCEVEDDDGANGVGQYFGEMRRVRYANLAHVLLLTATGVAALPLVPDLVLEYGGSSKATVLSGSMAPRRLPENMFLNVEFSPTCGYFTLPNAEYDLKVHGEGGQGAGGVLQIDAYGGAASVRNFQGGSNYPIRGTSIEVLVPTDHIVRQCNVAPYFDPAALVAHDRALKAAQVAAAAAKVAQAKADKRGASAADRRAARSARADADSAMAAVPQGLPLAGLALRNAINFTLINVTNHGRKLSVTPKLPHCATPPCRMQIYMQREYGQQAAVREQASLYPLTDVPYLVVPPPGSTAPRLAFMAGTPRRERGIAVTGMRSTGDQPYRAAMLSRKGPTDRHAFSSLCSGRTYYAVHEECQEEDALSRRLGGLAAGVLAWRKRCAAEFRLEGDVLRVHTAMDEAMDEVEKVAFRRSPELRALHAYRGMAGTAAEPPSVELHAPALAKLRTAKALVEGMTAREVALKAEKDRLLRRVNSAIAALEPRQPVPEDEEEAEVIDVDAEADADMDVPEANGLVEGL